LVLVTIAIDEKKILISTSNFGNQVSDFYKNLALEFTKNGYQVIFCFDGKIKEFPEKLKNISYYTYPNKRPTHFSDYIFIYKLIKKEKPQICISNFGSTNVVAIASVFNNVNYRLNYIHTTPQALKLDSNYNFFIKKFFWLRKLLIYKIHTNFLTNSTGNARDTSKEFYIPNEKITVIPLLIKQSNIPYREFSQRNNSICIVGRLSKNKGHKDLIYSFKNCTKHFSDLKLKIIGRGQEKSNLVNLCEKLKILDKVEFMDYVPNREIGIIFSSSLIAISASKSEAFGLVIIEALREGTPVICSRTEGSSDIIFE